ncbi:defective pharyngeal development protein 4-like [Cloeon dipterum]|uniref:defective pharyngeal development protein 4-like n=1 Tax=Cloeon dipterum TaxID=197152 RepID=UPI00321FF56D
MNSYVEQQEFTNNQVAAAKKLLTVTKSVDSTAQAVDSIISECISAADSQGVEPFDVFEELGADPKSFFDKCEFVHDGPEPTAAEWGEKKCYTTLETVQHPAAATAPKGMEVATVKEFDWLMNFKIGKLLDPLKDDYGPNDENRNIFNLLKAKNSEPTKPAPPPPPVGPKPPFTYTELIEQALEEKGALTVSGIYQWISQHFPYYRPNDDRWKNSVRHNLSINPHFSKGGKATRGAGHLWTVVAEDERTRSSWKRRRLEQYVNDKRRRESMTLDNETNQAASLLENSMDGKLDDSSKEGWVTTHIISLEQTAEDILMGVRREVEVEFLTKMPREEADGSCGSADSDFLNPISKHEAVQESGLLTDESQLNDLSLNHANADDFFYDEEMALQYYELALSGTA